MKKGRPGGVLETQSHAILTACMEGVGDSEELRLTEASG